MMGEAKSMAVNPMHYKMGSVEVKEMMIRIWGKEAYKLFCEMNSFKYRMRAGYKGDPMEDLAKAREYERQRLELDGGPHDL